MIELFELEHFSNELPRADGKVKSARMAVEILRQHIEAKKLPSSSMLDSSQADETTDDGLGGKHDQHDLRDQDILEEFALSSVKHTPVIKVTKDGSLAAVTLNQN